MAVRISRADAARLGLTVPKQPTPSGVMNQLEAAFAGGLAAWKTKGWIVWWAYEPINLRLAKRTWYRPDFAVIDEDGRLTFYETKGFFRDDARVKIKVAAETYRVFRFVVAKKVKGVWEYEWIEP